MVEDFDRRFRWVRDGDLTPRQSWLQRRERKMPQATEIIALKSLEYLEERDFEELLLLGAENGANFVDLVFRYRCTPEDAFNLCMVYYTSYFASLRERKVLNCFSFMPGLKGWARFMVDMYAQEDIPPEHMELISYEEACGMLLEAGCEPADDPPKILLS